MYRTRGRVGASHDSTPGTASVKRAGETGGPARGAGGRCQDHRQTNFARNLSRSFFETSRKRCNSNDTNSKFETARRELRAKLLRRRQGLLSTYSQTFPRAHFTLRHVIVEIPGFETTRHHTQRRRRRRCGGHRRDWWARPGCGARGRRQGLAGLRDRSLRAEGSRVAISRAGRRPRAHQAARPHGRARRRPEHQRRHKQHAHTKTPTRNRVGVSEPPVGIEPTTYSLRVNRSAD